MPHASLKPGLPSAPLESVQSGWSYSPRPPREPGCWLSYGSAWVQVRPKIPDWRIEALLRQERAAAQSAGEPLYAELPAPEAER